MKSNVVAAVAGGLILGGAIFLPLGANAVNQEIKQVTASEQKVAGPSVDTKSDVTNSDAADVVQTAGLDPVVSPDPTPTPTPNAVTGPTFSAGDDEDSNDDDSYSEDSEDGESDD